MTKEKKPELKPCPWCKTDEHLTAGHRSSESMAVHCSNCYCTGPTWSVYRVTGEDGCLLPEVYEKVKTRKKWPATRNKLDAYLLERAIEDWNNL